MYFFNKQKQKSKIFISAFTLVEAMVAISVLMVAVVSPLTIAQKGLSSAVFSKDQMIASYLAQDAIEWVKFYRDTKGIKGPDEDDGFWLAGSLKADCIQSVDNFIDPIGEDDWCPIDTTGEDNGNKDEFTLYIETDEDGNFVRYTHDNNTNTEESKFRRYVNIKTDGTDEALITVMVVWTNSTNENRIVIKNFIYNFWETFEGFPPGSNIL